MKYLKKFESDVVYTDEFKIRMGLYDKTSDLCSNIMEFIRSVHTSSILSSTRPSGDKFIIGVEEKLTFDTRCVVYITLEITKDDKLKISISFGITSSRGTIEKYSPILKYFSFLFFHKDYNEEYKSFSSIVEFFDVDKIITKLNIEDYDIYCDTKKYNM